MRILRHLRSFPVDLRGAVLAVGNFDGVHRGHQSVIGAAWTVARQRGVAHGVLTFEPHPRSYFRPSDPPFRLTPFDAKMQALGDLGCDLAVNLSFDAALAALDADAFIRAILIEGVGATHIVVGYDFVFGRERTGNVELLCRAGERLGFGVTVMEPATDPTNGVPISSTLIRAHLTAGEVDRAASLLGRPWEIDGPVEHGDQRGRTIGVPTANIDLGDYLRPALGVYAVRNGIEREPGRFQWIDGVANVGIRPTVGGEALRLESHLFDFAEDLYGRTLRVRLVARIREERKFDGIEALKRQITEDAALARRLLR